MFVAFKSDLCPILLFSGPSLKEVIMGRKLYVGNLPYSTNDSSLRAKFEEVGTVDSSKVITDRETGRSKGFGFIEMSTDEEAEEAISKFHGTEMDGRAMTVSEAKPMTPNDNRGGDRGGRGGFGGGGSRNRY
jgi:RNA recognition motif-containing protein